MKRRSITIAVAVAVVIGGAGWFWRVRAVGRAAPVDDTDIVRVTRRDIGTIVKATGVIKPAVGAEVRVGSRVSGVVEHLNAKVGDAVGKGQLLATLDDRDLVARRDQAEADLKRSVAERNYARSDLERQRRLGAAKVIAPGELELAERTSAVAEQQVAVAEAALAYASLQVDYARITAPIAGIVGSVSTQEGETVAASFAAPTFVTLVDLSRLEVRAYVDETDIGRIQPGQRARFTVDTYADTEFEGQVTTIYPQAEIRDNVVDYIAVIRFAPPAGVVLRPDMTTAVRIAVQQRERVLSLPLRAIRWEGGRAYVRLAGEDPAKRRNVTTGVHDDRAYEIVAGLREGDAVLVNDPLAEGKP